MEQYRFRAFGDNTFKDSVKTLDAWYHETFWINGFNHKLDTVQDIDFEDSSYIWITKDSNKLPVRCGIVDKNNSNHVKNIIFRNDEEYIALNYIRRNSIRSAKEYKQYLKRIISHYRTK